MLELIVDIFIFITCVAQYADVDITHVIFLILHSNEVFLYYWFQSLQGYMQCFVFLNLSCTDSTFEPPSEWSAMKDSDNLVVVLVKSGSPEYSSVIDRFHAQVGKKEIVQVREPS